MRIENAPDRDMTAMETQFGRMLRGDSCREEALAAEPQSQAAMHVMYEDKPLDKTLYEFFEREEIPDQEEPTLSMEEQQAMTFFHVSTTTHLPDGCYEVGCLRGRESNLWENPDQLPNVGYFIMSVL